MPPCSYVLLERVTYALLLFGGQYVPRRTIASIADSFLQGSNSAYIDQMYVSWRADPASVHKSWDAYFRTGSIVCVVFMFVLCLLFVFFVLCLCCLCCFCLCLSLCRLFLW